MWYMFREGEVFLATLNVFLYIFFPTVKIYAKKKVLGIGK